MKQWFTLDSKPQQVLAISGLIFFFLVFNFFSMRHLSQTTDEGAHYLYGMNILNLNSDRLVYAPGVVDDSKMPVSALNAIPAKIANFLSKGSLKNFLKNFTTARFITVIFSSLIALLVFRWSFELFGTVPAFASLILYIFDPNIIAHSELVTTDIYATGAVLFCTYWLWKFANTRRCRDGLIFLLVLGLSQLAKYTSIVMLPLSVLALVAHDWFSSNTIYYYKKNVGRYFRDIIFFVIMAGIACVIIINAGYLFNRSFTSFGNYQFESDVLQKLQTNTPAWLAKLPLPIPYPYLQGLDTTSFRASTGFGYGRIYLLGQLHEVDGFKGYYFIASLLKMPIAVQIIVLISIIIYFSDSDRRTKLWNDQVFLLIPVIFFAIYFNFFYNTQLGIRFYLVIYPLLYIFAGTLFENWRDFKLLQRITSFALLGYLTISVFSYYPHYLSYFNEFVWDRKTSYKYLADSNLDWGQNLNYLDQYLANHPDANYEPSGVMSGQKIIVTVNDLVGVHADSEEYKWLRENFEPVGTIAYSYLIYNVSSNDLAKLCETKLICEHQNK